MGTKTEWCYREKPDLGRGKVGGTFGVRGQGNITNLKTEEERKEGGNRHVPTFKKNAKPPSSSRMTGRDKGCAERPFEGVWGWNRWRNFASAKVWKERDSYHASRG